MKVKELIEILQTHDPEHLLLVDGYEGGYTHPKVRKAQVFLEYPDPMEKPEWYGEYEDADDKTKPNAVILQRG